MRLNGHETNSGKRSHHGRNIRRFREMIGLKQEALAWELGEEWSQKRVSSLEQREVIPQEVLELVSVALRIPVEAIRHFDEEMAIHNLRNNFADTAPGPANPLHPDAATGFPPGFNPVEKWVSALAENEKLYERLLKSEQEKVVLLQKILDQTLRNAPYTTQMLQ